MTDFRFEALVNLYLDREISPRELRHLIYQISKSKKRRQLFVRLRRIHSAEQSALGASSKTPSSLRDDISYYAKLHRPRESKDDAQFVQERKIRRLFWSWIAVGSLVLLLAGIYLGTFLARPSTSQEDTEIAKQLRHSPMRNKGLATGPIRAGSGWIDQWFGTSNYNRQEAGHSRPNAFGLSSLGGGEIWLPVVPSIPQLLFYQGYSSLWMEKIKALGVSTAGQQVGATKGRSLPGTSTPLDLPSRRFVFVLKVEEFVTKKTKDIEGIESDAVMPIGIGVMP